ncbi:MAG: GHMP family kinase ATP-binding protein [Armatimonadota bacterium]
MIISQTPLRISFAGGGTDFPDFYLNEGGCVVSSSIDKFIYVTIKDRFDKKIRVGYSKTEMVDSVDEVQHDLVRECLRKTGIEQGVEISTMADIPSEGSGLGSSSSVTVGLLNAMYAYQCNPQPHNVLAEQACEIEIDILKRPIGKQDQYIAAFGNLRMIQFKKTGEVQVDNIPMDWDRKKRFSASLLLFYSGVTRDSGDVLYKQKSAIPDRKVELNQLKQQAHEAQKQLAEGNIDEIGRIMNEGWLCKKKLADNISNSHIDGLYDAAIQAGAIGGKVAGAGGGGFLLLYCPPERHAGVRKCMWEHELQELAFSLGSDGSIIMLNSRR